MPSRETEQILDALGRFDRLSAKTGLVDPPDVTAARTRAFVKRFPYYVAAQLCGVHHLTLARCGCGMSMQAGALAAIEAVVHRDFEEFAELAKVLTRADGRLAK